MAKDGHRIQLARQQRARAKQTRDKKRQARNAPTPVMNRGVRRSNIRIAPEAYANQVLEELEQL